jgi:mannitol/fructose-specific phosphotransferase system IIA component (Ntr-type)
MMQAAKSPQVKANLADIFPPESVIMGLEKRTIADVVGELVHRLVENQCIAAADEQSLAEMVLAREKLGSTALGNAMAFPHCRASVTETFVGAVAIDDAGIEFNSLDKGLVHVVFLLVGPLTNRETHFELLGRIAGIGRQKPMLLQLRGSSSPEEVCQLLKEWDAGNGV